MDCIFCKVAKGEVQATVVQQNDRYLAFRDINPQAPQHLLVIPKTHMATVNDATDAGHLGGLLLFARDVARAQGVGDRGYRLVINTNGEGGQTVFHLHVHVLGGRAMQWPPG